MFKPVIAISLSIFLTILLFFTFYVMSYAIVHGGLYTAKLIKNKWRKYCEDSEMDKR